MFEFDERLIIDHCLDIKLYYKAFDKCHDTKHFYEVFKNALYAIDNLDNEFKNQVSHSAILLAAAYHDVGRLVNEKDHHEYSATIFKNDFSLKYLLTTQMNEQYEDIIHYAYNMIYLHRRRFHKNPDSLPKEVLNDPYLTELCRIIYDCDKCMQSDKDRVLYRYIGYYIDHMNNSEKIHNSNQMKKMVNNRWEKMGNGLYPGFNPVSETFKRTIIRNGIYNTGPFEFTKDDIEECYLKNF